MANHIDARFMIDRRKRKRNSIPDSPPNRNLTPVTIMVADSIGVFRSRKLLKVLLDSGSTTTLINKKCLPKKCRPCQISQSKMVNTLAGFCQLSAMVVIAIQNCLNLTKIEILNNKKHSYLSQIPADMM